MPDARRNAARRWRTRVVAVLVCGSAIGAGVYLALHGVRLGDLTTAKRTQPAATRPARWATPMSLPGLPNLHKVSDTLYRGAQPTAEGMRELHKLGVKTVVNLRALHSDRDEIGRIPLAHEHIRMVAWHPEDEEAVRFLRIVTDNSRTPVFVHCQYGADRTGTMCALYRVVVQGWTPDEAAREMSEGGFGFHAAWANLVRYVHELDAAALRKKAGL